MSGERNTIRRWKIYLGSWLSIAEGEMRERRSVCIAILWDGWHLICIAGAVVFLKSPMP